MTTAVVYYRTGYRHQLVESFEMDVAAEAGIFPVTPGGNEFVNLTLGGDLNIAIGYAWNGANWPAINTKSFVRPSLVHDALRQLWELGIIDDVGLAASDRLLAKMLREDGLIIANRQPWFARWPLKAIAYVRPFWVEAAVSWYSEHFASMVPDQILTAP